MTAMRKLVRAQISSLGEDEVRVVMSTAALARDGHILVPQGCLLENYRANPIVLWSHDPDQPIGNAENIFASASQLTALIRFAPAGISRKADEIRGLMKAGVVRAVSVGFDPIEGEPLDPKRQRGGQRFTKWELLELSPVSIPADTGAVVTERSGRSGKVLSGANAEALRDAHDLAERCRSSIASVLDAADGDRSHLSADYRRRQAELLRMEGVALKQDYSTALEEEASRARMFGKAKNADQHRRQLDCIRLGRSARG